jgi:dipeptidase E
MTQNIIAVGGGGFGADPNNVIIDRYILSLTGKERPKVCFLPQASAESQQYIVNFFSAYTKLGAEPSWASLFGRVPNEWRDTILKQDVIYVGGGNTKTMLAIWREWGMDEVLKEALANGTILAGISAGAICWFDACVTDSVWPLGTIRGMGLLAGSACPHYDGEPERRPTLLRMIADKEIIDGIAICDHAAAHYVDGKLKQVVVSRDTAKAFYVSHKNGEAVEEEIPIKLLEAVQ